mmetsp:Transcript_98066/g.280611  ORF Transcript_98066/g.280611 Transcript_98066/m.280611 type:complete len:222 (+) Transcript_98066:229-894(+)
MAEEQPVITNKAGEPVEGCTLCLVKLQGPCISWVRPAQWIRPCFGKHHSHENWFWPEGTDLPKIKESFQNVKSLQNYEIMRVTDSHFMARKYTPFLQWVDVVDITVSKDAESGTYRGDAWSMSAGCCPASCCCAPLGGLLCCLFPFGDHGKTAKHLDHVKGVFASNGAPIGHLEVLTFGESREHSASPRHTIIDRVWGEAPASPVKSPQEGAGFDGVATES